ncbi:MAG TPA: ubiquinol-cytochrome c reductase iron-sulfur subunit [Candidatus Acidoferrales bacterium]|jgi:cytochrome b6-f complex iron-sulfur subunit|nr:ubiquinol-cytochrome c reductase iron-sulfur subunit [Verrucomicrobiae bacterium]HZP33510.1 ubiquinol-cytochrome c reductase iron-sulfur subunit [Candidatus Acidoferrales bacterium]
MTDANQIPPGETPSNPRTRLITTRREFLNEAALAALGIAAVGSLIVTYGYLSPNVLFEPPTTFRAGNPDLYPLNSVTFLEDQQVYVVHAENGFYAVSAVCTHLGCITQWKPDLGQIACPCHGSKFKSDGTKIEGPAPRPLPHFAISLTADGELQVDKLEIISPGQALKA